MNTALIQSSEYEKLKISALPTSPTADVNYGGCGYSASQMKAAFDALPLFIIQKLNALIEDISAEPELSICNLIKTGLNEEHTLAELFTDLASGTAASYITVGNESLSDAIASLRQEIEQLKAVV